MKPLFSWYGDDFTGSTDALEAVASSGIESVLFPEAPDAALLRKFAHCQAFGIAGESRSRGPAWMDARLPGIFESLRGLGAPVCQYKVCSTFDSSPEFGSIGRALEIGRRVFGNPWVPVAVAAPHLQRYVLFGNLFAVAAGTVYRIDRHPTMKRHPVTPMGEADLRIHLARQTELRIGLLDILALAEPDVEQRLAAGLAEGPAAVLFDGLREDSVATVGRLIWERRTAEPMFCLGSSGLTHALVLHWRAAGMIPAEFTPPAIRPVEQVIVISGSCSPATEAQLRWAMANGYAGFRVGEEEPAERALAAGRNVAVYSALGPGDCAGPPRGEELGAHLGSLLLEWIRRSGVRRVVIAGGDTSSHAARRLGVEALTFAGLLSPGAPLCRAHSKDPAVDGLELVLKGGQVGPEDFFERVRKGDR